MLRIKNLECYYNDKLIFKNINIDLNKNEMLIISGSNGSGKTSFCNSLIAASNNKDKLSLDNKPLGKQISYIKQNRELNINLPITVNEILKIYFSNKEIDKIMQYFDLEKYKETPYLNLSGGNKQLIKILTAITSTTKVLILDEPNNNLDKKNRQILNNMLDKLSNQINVILVTHYLDELPKKAKYIFDMDKKVLKKVVNNVD